MSDRADIDKRRTESEFSAKSFWGDEAYQCKLTSCFGLWHRSDLHMYPFLDTIKPMHNIWDEPSGPLVMERGDMIVARGIPHQQATIGIVIGVDLGREGWPEMVTIAMLGSHSPRYDGPKPSGDTWCFIQSVQVSRYEILKKRVR